MRFDTEELVSQIPRTHLHSPTILAFKTRAPEARVVANVDDIIPGAFRVYYREGIFSVRAPKQMAETATEARSRHGRHRHRKPARTTQTRLPASRQEAVQPSGPQQRRAPKRAPPHKRQTRLVFLSGVRGDIAARSGADTLLSVADDAAEAAVDAAARSVTAREHNGDDAPSAASDAARASSSRPRSRPCAESSRAGRRLPTERCESHLPEALGSTGIASASDPLDTDSSYRRHRLKRVNPRNDSSWISS